MSRDFPPPEEEAVWQAQLDEYESNLWNQASKFFARKYAQASKKQVKTVKAKLLIKEFLK